MCRPLALVAVLLAALSFPPNATAADAPAMPPPPSRVRIYQLLVRLFGNTNPTRKPNGTLAENGVGKLADINDAALDALRDMGFTHVWLTGVLQQATGTDYSAIGRPADDPDLLKGLAGSPYAIKDYYDVCPDYAQDPARRLEEFGALLERIHGHGMKAIIDYVPNHVARSYHSGVHPELDFGLHDDRTKFFARDNNFYYLPFGDPSKGHVPPLRLPTYDFKTGQPMSATCKVLGGACDGLFKGETDFGRVTGNNEVSWTPGRGSWYETVKLNYGFDFTDPAKQRHDYAGGSVGDGGVPDTWTKMDAILAYWQQLGVDGFRCDMAHMIPPDFWRWAIARAHGRGQGVFFMAEAYDDDPNNVPFADPAAKKKPATEALVEAGFDAVYDHMSYKIAKRIYEGPAWANDLDAAARNEKIFQRSLRYAENHDEVRLAAPSQWGGIGMQVGRPVSGLLFALSRGPVMIYGGQEVGEPAAGAEGFSGDDARSSIFDYWSMPELVKWVDGHTFRGASLSEAQKALRAFYGRLVRAAGEPAFRDGGFFPLNPANAHSERFGKVEGDSVGGHWLYACLRYDAASGQRVLVVVNLHRSESFEKVSVRLPVEALAFLGLPGKNPAMDGGGPGMEFKEWLFPDGNAHLRETGTDGLGAMMLELDRVPPLTPLYFEMKMGPAE